MPVPEQYKDWNAEAVTEAKALLQRAERLGSRAALLRDGVWAIFVSRAQRVERRLTLAEAAKLRTDAGAWDLEIVDYWRIKPDVNQGTSPEWFRTKMSSFAIVRDTVLRYVNEAVQTVHDNQLRAAARATLWISIVILAFSAVAAVYPIAHDHGIEANISRQAPRNGVLASLFGAVTHPESSGSGGIDVDITNPSWRCGYFAIALAVSLVYGMWAVQIFGVTPKPTGWGRVHQHWLNFLSAFAGWLAGWVVLNRWLACPSFMCADEPKFATAAVAIVAVIGMTGLLPLAIVTGIRGLEKALDRWLSGK